MVIYTDSRWVLLAWYLSKQDRAGLESLRSEWFTGLSRITYEAALASVDFTPINVLHQLRFELDDQSFKEVQNGLHCLAGYEMADVERDIEHHINAVSTAYAHRMMEEIIDEAHFRIHDGQNRFAVAEELRTQLDRIHLRKPLEKFDDILERLGSADEAGILSGIPRFAAGGVEAWMNGNIITLGGDSGSYKTTFAIHLAESALRSNPELHVLYFMKEQPSHEVWFKLCARNSTETYTDIQHKMNAKHPAFMRKVKMQMKTHEDVLSRMHVIDQREFDTPSDIAAIIRGFCLSHKSVMWFVDYLTRLEFGGKNSSDYNIAVARGLGILKGVSLSTGSVGVIVSQLVKGWNIDDTRRPAQMFPNRGHLIWSSELINLSAYILMLYHPRTYFNYPREVFYTIFNKIRHSEGQFRVPFLIRGEEQRFVDIPDGRVNEIQQYELQILKGGRH